MKKLKIVVGGYVGLFPMGGAAWDYVQYPLGLHLLGHDVYYIEDTQRYPTFQAPGKDWTDATDSVEHLKRTMENFGLASKWAYRDIGSGICYGMQLSKVLEVCKNADVFINISCSTFLRDEYLAIPNRILIDSDPMFTQVQYYNEVNGNANDRKTDMRSIIEKHNYLFTFGENIGAEDCLIPLLGFTWHPTRQPICLDQWVNNIIPHNKYFSSVLNWCERPKLFFNNQSWGQKNVEFMKFIKIPCMSQGTEFQMLIKRKPVEGEVQFEEKQLVDEGWKVYDPHDYITSASAYREFILHAYAEFSIAKETYVKSNSGWFSCRSACYLAAGKPVVAQDTCWSRTIPAGTGLFSFNTIEEAIQGIKEVEKNYAHHSKAAIDIANEYFDSNKVLADILAIL